MFEYLGLAYRDSDDTAVIAIMYWPERKKLVLKLTLVVEIWPLLSRHRPPLLKRSLRLPVAVPFIGKAHEDSNHTAVIAVVHWRLHAETPCWLSCECCNNVLSSFWSPLLAINWAWLPCGMCVNVLQYLACDTAGCNTATLWMSTLNWRDVW